MKKIFTRVMAAAMVVPMALTQSVLGVSAEGTGAKALTMDTFLAIPADKTESEWNLKLLNVIASMNGTQQEIAKDDFLALLPESNSYAILLKEVMNDAAKPVLTVKNDVVSVSGTVDLSEYAKEKIYDKINEAAGKTLTLDAFNKIIDFSVTVDASVLENGKTATAVPSIVVEGTNLGPNNTYAYLQGLAKELAVQVAAQTEITNDVKNAMDIQIINKVKRAERWYDTASTIVRSGSYDTADEAVAALSRFVNNRTEQYPCPSSVAEMLERHSAGVNQAVRLLSDITETRGYTLDISANDIAELAYSGSAFEVASSSGTFNMSFQIPDAEAAEVEAYVNDNAVPNEDGVTMVYDRSYKLVEAEATVDGVGYFNVTRVIEYKEKQDTTTSTTDTTTTTTATDTNTDTVTTTTTTTGTGTGTETGTGTVTGTETGTGTGTGTETGTGTVTGTETGTGTGTVTGTETGTGTGTGTETGTGTVTSTETGTGTGTVTTVDPSFMIESVEIAVGEDYYFSHDENAFDLSTLVTNLTLVGNINGEAMSIAISPADYNKYLTPIYATPAAYFNAVPGTAYVASPLELTFNPADVKTADTYDASLSAYPTVYIGVKGDANLDALVDTTDASMVLSYFASHAAGIENELNADPNLNKLAYFLADIDTESKEGMDTEMNKLNVSDATNILTYYAKKAAGFDAKWEEIVG